MSAGNARSWKVYGPSIRKSASFKYRERAFERAGQIADKAQTSIMVLGPCQSDNGGFFEVHPVKSAGEKRLIETVDV